MTTTKRNVCDSNCLSLTSLTAATQPPSRTHSHSQLKLLLSHFICTRYHPLSTQYLRCLHFREGHSGCIITGMVRTCTDAMYSVLINSVLLHMECVGDRTTGSVGGECGVGCFWRSRSEKFRWGGRSAETTTRQKAPADLEYTVRIFCN